MQKKLCGEEAIEPAGVTIPCGVSECARCCYDHAVENAERVLKERATGFILSNNEDGVAKYLKAHVCL